MTKQNGTLPYRNHVWEHVKVTASQAVLAALNWGSSAETPDFSAKRPQVFPNPLRERLWFTGLFGGKSIWEIFDLRGQLCQSGQTFDLSSIAVSTRQPELHVIHVQSGHLSKSFKFLKHPWGSAALHLSQYNTLDRFLGKLNQQNKKFHSALR